MPGAPANRNRMGVLSREVRAAANSRLPSGVPPTGSLRGPGLSQEAYRSAPSKARCTAKRVVDDSSPSVSNRSSSSDDFPEKWRPWRQLFPREDHAAASVASSRRRDKESWRSCPNDRAPRNGVPDAQGHSQAPLSLWDVVSRFEQEKQASDVQGVDEWNGLISSSPASPRKQSLPNMKIDIAGSSASAASSCRGTTPRRISPQWQTDKVEEPNVGMVQGPVDNLIESVCSVIHDMLQIKYGLFLDLQDMFRKIETTCSLGISGNGETQVPLTPMEVVTMLNGHQDLQFRTNDGHALVSLRIESRRITSFEEVRSEVRRLHGTARIVAVVNRGVVSKQSSTATPFGDKSLTALAVFREDYSQSNVLVGRSLAFGNGPFLSFSADALCEAFALEPEICCIFECGRGLGELIERSPPPLREEYKNLASRLLSHTAASGYSSSSSAAVPQLLSALALVAASDAASLPSPIEPVQQRPTSQSLHLPNGGTSPPPPPPTPVFMKALRQSLENPSIRSDNGKRALDMLQQVSAWLDKDAGAGLHTVNEASKAMDRVGLQYGLVACMRNAFACSIWDGEELSAAISAARCVGLALRNSKLDASFTRHFADAGCVPALCDILERWPDDEDVQRTVIFALRQLVEDESAGIEALYIGASRAVSSSARRFPEMPDLQLNSEQAISCMSKHREAWLKRPKEHGAQRMRQPPSPPPDPLLDWNPIPTSGFEPPFLLQMQAPNLFTVGPPMNLAFPPSAAMSLARPTGGGAHFGAFGRAAPGPKPPSVGIMASHMSQMPLHVQNGFPPRAETYGHGMAWR